jgi:AcrR family transcriptional regulator
MGVARATLDDIADRAGVSKGTIYLYFPNKEELFRRTVKSVLATASVRPDPTLHGSATRQLLDTVERHWRFLTSPDALVVSRLVNAERWQFPDLAELYAERVVSKLVEELAPVIRRGSRDAEFREVEPGHAARMLTALVVHSALWRVTGEPGSMDEGSTGAVLRELTDFYLHAIAPAEGAFPQADGAPHH